MRKKLLVLVLMLFELISKPVCAEDSPPRTITIYTNGEQLTAYCRSFLITQRQRQGTTQQYADAANCYGYVTGVFDTLSEVNMLGQICVPAGSNANSLSEVVAKFLDENPERRNQSGAELVMEAWLKSFPCASR